MMTTDVLVQWVETHTYQTTFKMTAADAAHAMTHSPEECDDGDDCPIYHYILALTAEEIALAFSSLDERWITYQKEAP